MSVSVRGVSAPRTRHGFPEREQRGEYAERISDHGVHRVQTPQLHDDAQQAYDDQPSGDEEILPDGEETHVAPRSEVIIAEDVLGQ